MSTNPLKKWNDDLKKNFDKFTQDFNDFFKIPKKEPPQDMGKQLQEKKSIQSGEKKPILPQDTTSSQSITPSISPLSQLSSSSSTKIVESSAAKPNPIMDNWNKLIESSQQTTQKMQQQWQQNYEKFQEKLKRSNEKVKSQLQAANQNMTTFFKNQQQQTDEFFKKVDSEMKSKSEDNREKALQSINGLTTGWGNFVHKQQIQFEKTMGTWNKLAWRGQLNFILWLIPIIILFIVIFSLLRPFLSM